jgi:hypothetical protein
MRAYQTIPCAMVCDNGTYIKGKLFTDFCQRLGIRLIHSVVHHPQTNGNKTSAGKAGGLRDVNRSKRLV